MSDLQARNKMASDVIEVAGTTLADALDILSDAERMLALLATPMPTREAEEEMEPRGPFGFAAYHWNQVKAA